MVTLWVLSGSSALLKCKKKTSEVVESKMGFEVEGRRENKMLKLKLTPRLNRSKSVPVRVIIANDNPDYDLEATDRKKLDMGYLKECAESRKKHIPASEAQSPLNQEILQLERNLQGRSEVRCILEKALGCRPSSPLNSNDKEMPKLATEIIKEIAVLEVEVVYLEQHLLSLYRRAFDQEPSSVSPSIKAERVESPMTLPRARSLKVSKPEALPKQGPSAVQSNVRELGTLQKEHNFQSNGHELGPPRKEHKERGPDENSLDSNVLGCPSSKSQCSAVKTSHPVKPLAKSLHDSHSQSLSVMEVHHEHASSNRVSLADHLRTCISDHVQDTPNRLSEDMVKCISRIFCKLGEPPSTHPGLSSPSSSLSSVRAFSPADQGNLCSPGFRNNASFDVQLDNPFHVEGLMEFSGPYSTMIDVSCIYKDNQKLIDAEQLLQNFRSQICRLEEVNPEKLNHEEKLAFWINIHNALVMHAFLAYGIPQNNIKRFLLLLKAAYNVGGRIVSVDTIQSTILGCRMPCPGQWLRLILSPKTKLRTAVGRHAYAIEHPDPLLYFALCTANHSDPAVRVYTPKRVLQELEVAKEEYIRANFGVRKDRKILIPKLVESFAKESGLCPADVIEVVQQCLPESISKRIKKCHMANSRKRIEWIPHNFTFRYLISKELLK